MSSTDSQPSERPTVRYEAQAHPRQGSRSAAEEQNNAWVGAFERVLGDHAEEEAATTSTSAAADSQRKNKDYTQADDSPPAEAKASHVRASTHRNTIPRQRSKSHLRNAWGPSDQTSPTEVPAATITSTTSPPPPEAQAVQDAPDAGAAAQSRHYLHPASASNMSHSSASASASQAAATHAQRSQATSPSSSTLNAAGASRLAHKGSNRSLRTATSSNGGSGGQQTPIPPSRPAPIRTYRPAPEGQEDEDDDGGNAQDDIKGDGADIQGAQGLTGDGSRRTSLDASNDASLGLSRTASGPTLLEVTSRHQKDKVCFPDLYLNHAPGLQPVKLRNILGPGKSVLVRLESDLGHAVSFMRRKRTAPRNELAGLNWPSNTLAWARGEGLSPQKLRELRAISVNLEVADSLILEGGASTEIFVIFRASLLPDTKTSPHQVQGSAQDQRSRSHSSSSAGVSSSREAQTALPRSTSPIPANDGASGIQAAPSTSPHSTSEVTGVSSTAPTQVLCRQREADGKIVIRAWQLPNLPPPPSNATLESRNLAVVEEPGPSDDGAGSQSSRSSAASSRPTSIHGSSSVSSASASISTALTDLSESEPQIVTLPVIARFCRPQIALAVQPPGTQPEHDGPRTAVVSQTQGITVADFGEVYADDSVSTELTLVNQSEIECYWQCRVDFHSDEQSASPCISIVDSDTSQSLDIVRPSEGPSGHYLPHILAPHSVRKLKLTLRPQHAGSDMEEMVTFTNLHNTTNAIRLAVRANVRVPGAEPALQVVSGPSLDFGDCCGGQWARQLLVLYNSVEHSLDLTLNAQKGYEVTFQRAKVADAEEVTGEDMSVGATAASSDGSTALSERALSATGASSRSNSLHGGRSDADASSAAADLERSPLDSHTSIAMELSRTPTHHASLVPNVEPPTFDLGGKTASETVEADLERTPLVLTPFAHPPAPLHTADGEDSEDNSSVASQAGSRPSSPVPSHPVAGTPSVISDIDGYCGSGEAASVAGRSAVSSAAKKDKTKDNVLAWRDAHEGNDADARPFRPSREQSGSFSTSDSASQWTGVGSLDHVTDEAVSIASDMTGPSQGQGSVALSQRSQSVTGAAQVQRGSSNVGGLRSLERSESADLEELSLRPGEEARIIVSFRPNRAEVDDKFAAGRLNENIFRLILDYTRARSTGGDTVSRLGSHSRPRSPRERRVVLCRTRTCTSFITVSPTHLDFGEVNVGSRKTGQIEVTNHSDLSARVDLRFVSKVLSMYRDEMAIPANQSIHLSVDYSPRRINLAYSKQITVANLLNRRNDQIVEVRGKNVDKQRISFHSLFYRILTPDGSNFLEFGDVNINSSRVRTFSIENTSRASLTLDITTAHPEDVALYVKAKPALKDAESGLTDASEALGKVPPKTVRTTKGYEDTEPSITAKSTVARALASENGRGAANPKGTELKERFLESISSDTPAHVRQENTSWRTAQQLSHFRKDAAPPPSALGSSKEGSQYAGGTVGAGGAKIKQAVNLVSALKKGGKGRSTQSYGRSVTFKDRSLLQMFESLDLASGPALTANRISVKSKCFQTLEQLETKSASKIAGKASGAAADDAIAAAPSDGRASPKAEDRQSSGLSSGTASSAVSSSKLPPSTPVKSKQGIPASLARDIKSKAGTPSKAIGRGEKTGTDRSPALTGKKKLRQTALEPEDVPNLSLDELLSALESQPSTLSTLFFNSAPAEEKHVRTEINLLRELRHAVDSKQLEPLEVLKVAPGEERQVIAIYCPNGSTRPHIQGTARKQDSRIFLRLMEFDLDAVRDSEEFQQMVQLDKDELPIRDLMVRTTTCRALLELGQPHINFGQMEKGESKTRKILIHNRSEWAARYCIRKSGSIASGDVKLKSGRYGVVSAHGKREVEFIFSPSLTGPFQEKLVIENIADRDRDLTVFLKANVRKKPNFIVEPTLIDFGECKPGKLGEPQNFTVSNTTNKPRTFVVNVDSSDLRHQRTIMDLVFTAHTDGDGTRSKADDASIADEIEHLSQKLKIATRKGHEDKIKKYEARLTELGVPLNKPATAVSEGAVDEEAGENAAKGEALAQETAAPDGTAAEKTTEKPELPSDAVSVREEPAGSRLKRVASTVTVGLAPNQSKRITVRLRTSAVHTALTAKDASGVDASHSGGPDSGAPACEADGPALGEDVSLNVQIHEVKNQDETINVTVRARALWSTHSATVSESTCASSTRPTIDCPTTAPPAQKAAATDATGEVSSTTDVFGEIRSVSPTRQETLRPQSCAETEMEEADPLPDDASAIIFTSNTL